MEQLIILAVFLSLGYFFGKMAEKKHYQSIFEREKKWLSIPVTASKQVMGDSRPIANGQLLVGNMVVSVDYFKRMLAGLRGIFGGSVQSYETLLDRARREAVLRMIESCPNADCIINLRLETSSIYKGQGNQIGSVEVLAYGTAIFFQK